jgi:hypothetical protein
MKTFICSLVLTICCAASVYADRDPLLRAAELERKVNAGKITEVQFVQAVDSLLDMNDNSSDAVFIRALLYAASAQWVGQANNRSYWLAQPHDSPALGERIPKKDAVIVQK